MNQIRISNYNTGVICKYALLPWEVTVRVSFWHASFHVEEEIKIITYLGTR